ncbi:hypothetical protein FKW77_002540 [Venturia effusa]|uniref:Uncharacterized protein n=1 Tax=Venturia effusa TaxID=50376 RepID=A0A517LAI7_9PEZI|nr:hypothetical protein FKW77_002540 [Venturia effusa]
MDKLVDKALSCEEKDASQQLYNIIGNFATKKGVGKKAPTNACTHKLLNFLLDDDHPKRTRRWAGILLQTLITKIPALSQYVLGLTNLLPFLGRLATRDDEEFKLLSATLIRALAGSDTQRLSLFWPADELSSSQIGRFPLTESSSGKQWIEDLTSFMDDSFSQTKAQIRLQVNFIQAVDIHTAEVSGKDLHIMPEKGSLYMILQDSITIMKVPITSSDPFFLEIPFDMISSVNVHTSTLVASQEPSASENVYQLLLNMEQGAYNHHICVSDGEARTMLLTFNDMTQANRVAIYIDDERMHRRTSRPKMSMSQPLNISQEAEASTSPEQPAEAVTPQASEKHEIKPAPLQAPPAKAPSRRIPQRKSTKSTIGGDLELAGTNVVTPRSRREVRGPVLAESIVEDNSGTETEQRSEDGVAVEPTGTIGHAAGNLSMLLSAALSPGSEQPLFQSARKTRDDKLSATVKGTADSASKDAKPKVTTTKVKSQQSKARRPVTKKTANARSKAVEKISTSVTKTAETPTEEKIWEIPDDAAELNTTATKRGKSKAVATVFKTGIRKGPARSAKMSAITRRTQATGSESDTDQDGDHNDGNFKAPSASLVPSSSSRRSARLQASAVKREPATAQALENHDGDDSKSRDMEATRLPTRSLPHIQSSGLNQRIDKVGQTTEPATTESKTLPVITNRSEAIEVTKLEARGKKRQSPVVSREEVESAPAGPPPQEESMETIEAFEDAVVDFATEPYLEDKEVIIKKEPGLKSKMPERTESEQIRSSGRPISIASDPDSEDNSEDDYAVEDSLEAIQQNQNSKPTTKADQVQDNSSAVRGVDEAASMVENPDAMASESHAVVRESQPLIETSRSLARQDSTPVVASEPPLIDNRSARKMAIISFDRSGPRNQGAPLGLRSADGTPVVRSDPAPVHGGSEATSKSHGVRNLPIQLQPTVLLPVCIEEVEGGRPRSEKRQARSNGLERQPVKRKKTAQSTSEEHGSVDIESDENTAGMTLRRASQRSVHVTDDGSPMRNDFEEEVTAMNAGFGDLEDHFHHHQDSEKRTSEPVKHNVPVLPVGLALHNLESPTSMPEGTQKRKCMSRTSSPAKGSSSMATDMAQRPMKTLLNRIVEDSKCGESADQGLLSILRSSQLRSQASDGEPGSMNPAKGATSPSLQLVGSRADRPSLDAPRCRTRSGRAQRNTAPMSSNHKPLPQPPDLDYEVISAYAPAKEIEKAVARNREEETLNDPFSSSQKNDEASQSFFMRRLATLMGDGASKAIGGHVAEDADKTLVEDVPMEDVESSSSSSDNELAVVVEEPEEEDNERAEVMEWEAALQPRHREMFEVLGRITRRLVSHLIDSETAVEDIVDDYSRDGTRIVEEFEKCFRSQQSNVGGLQVSMMKLSRLYCDMEHHMVQDHNALRTDIGSSLHDWNVGMHGKTMAIEQMERTISA